MSTSLFRNPLMEPQILLMILVGKLAISAGRMAEKLSGASNVIGEDTVTVASLLGEIYYYLE